MQQKPGLLRWTPDQQKLFPGLVIAFVLVQLTLFLFLGVETGLEAEKYVSQGRILFEQGHLTEAKYLFYLPVILLVWLSHLLHVPVEWVVLPQVLLSGFAQYCFFRLVRSCAGQPTAILASLLLLAFLPLQAWNFFLYSDSIFISVSIIFFWTLHQHAARGWKGNLIVLAVLFLLILSRPHGLLFIPPTFVYYLIIAPSVKQRWATLGAGISLLAAMFLFMNRIFTGGEDMNALKPFVEEHIICFVPQNPNGAELNLQQTGSPVADIFYYVLHNPLHFIRLMFLRLYSFFNLSRPFYSVGHNIAILAFLIPIYLFAVKGIIQAWTRQRPFVYFYLLLLFFYPLGVTFQCDDWHSRFTMIVMPIFIYFASYAAVNLYNKRRNPTQ